MLNPETLREIATDFQDPEQILRAIEATATECELPRSHWVPARGIEEQILVEIWEGVLRRSPIGVYDDFFALGGNSLSAIQVLSRASGIFLTQLPLRLMFENRTISGLALAVNERRLVGAEGMALPPLVKGATGGFRSASFAQESLWLAAELNPLSPAYAIAGALRIRGEMDVAALRWSLNRIVERHESLRTSFEMFGGELRQIVEPNGYLDLQPEDVCHAENDEWRRRAHDDVKRSFSLRETPLLRVRLFRTEAQEWILCLILHHTIADGWSFGVLENELSALYQERVTGASASLPELHINYGDYAEWQRSCVQLGLLDGHLAWWTARLTPAAPKLHLQSACPDSVEIAGYVQLALGQDLSSGIAAKARQLSSTLHMFFMAGLAAVLYRITGEQDIRIGTPVAGRSQIATEALIGLFVNTLVICVRFDGDPTFEELQQRVKEDLLACHEHQEIPLEAIMKATRATGGEGGVPFEVLFALQNVPGARFQPTGCQVTREELRTGASRFPLSIWCFESDNGMVLDSEFDRKLFSASFVEQILLGLRNLLQKVTTSEHLRILDIPLDNLQDLRLTPPAKVDRSAQFRF